MGGAAAHLRARGEREDRRPHRAGDQRERHPLLVDEQLHGEQRSEDDPGGVRPAPLRDEDLVEGEEQQRRQQREGDLRVPVGMGQEVR